MQHKKARQALEGAAKGGLRSNGVGRDPRNPGSATHKERHAAKGMAVPKASAAKKFRRQIDSAPPVSRQNNALNSVINKC